jgi:formylmethanofuran:tetrahydromethanopterin formyltransferase
LIKYKAPASTNHRFCPLHRSTPSDSSVLSTVQSVCKFVFNGIDTDTLGAMGIAVAAAEKVPGVARITAVDSDGRLGPCRISLVDSLRLVLLIRLSMTDRLH